MLDDLVRNRVDARKPRKEGLTCTVDKLQGIDKENFSTIAPFIDVVKIYGVLPMLMSEENLKKKIKFYHDFGVQVSTGSTITEYAISENSLEKFVREAARVGFDIVEVGENSIDLSFDQKKKISDTIKSTGLEFQWKVGKKDPRHQLTIDDTLVKIEEAVKIGSKKIVLEANEGVNVGIYDEKALVKWSFRSEE